MLEYICSVCGAPSCAFARFRDGDRVCVSCARIAREGQSDQRVFRATGVLNAATRGYTVSARGEIVDAGRASGIVEKTKALIRHDQILNGPQCHIDMTAEPP